MPHDNRSVSVERTIDAPPEKIFAVVADPAQHRAIDGSGMVRGPPAGERGRLLALGDEFGMSMRWGMPYSMVNTVVECEANRRIAWEPHVARPAFVRSVMGGHRWRYELEPVDGGTRVRETYDWSRADPGTRAWIRAAKWPARARRAMEKTLERLDTYVTGGDAGGAA